MATRMIPAKRIFICDGCKREEQRRVMDCEVTFERAGLDYQGSPVGPGGQSWELCDECCMTIEGALLIEIAKLNRVKK